ncbi:glycosyl transferase [Caldisphaera lagunensis DSM 15908]|uniref:Glycosyl transferase n=1 Tax=Caldisphaera lagunensis (strain DSM 15908 / JCM 11604 / ANMR 0165 / IC-154) TaxID=1056495 RepID=L0AB57_CALLD|nr:glycosyltransferase family 2 protein [Caldisphaera lagunensis]AFZ70649.1 glycosyl transferase [Caldisphaera lagunensis DSM 15908]
MKNLKISVIIPTLCNEFLLGALSSLENQKRKPDEVIVIYKCNNIIEKLIDNIDLSMEFVKQEKGHVTNALNIGKNKASGDIIVITDDDVILPKDWIKNYEIYFNSLKENYAGVCSRDIWINENKEIIKSPDDKLITSLYRNFYVKYFIKPHILFKDFKNGVFISKNYKIFHGSCIPKGKCISLPFRGVNMAFFREKINDIDFPEINNVKYYHMYEQYIGVKLVKKGLSYLYVPDNPVFHYYHKSLSKNNKAKEEDKIMLNLIKNEIES